MTSLQLLLVVVVVVVVVVIGATTKQPLNICLMERGLVLFMKAITDCDFASAHRPNNHMDWQSQSRCTRMVDWMNRDDEPLHTQQAWTSIKVPMQWQSQRKKKQHPTDMAKRHLQSPASSSKSCSNTRCLYAKGDWWSPQSAQKSMKTFRGLVKPTKRHH